MHVIRLATRTRIGWITVRWIECAHNEADQPGHDECEP
jgi:hypothetical protein